MAQKAKKTSKSGARKKTAAKRKSAKKAAAKKPATKLLKANKLAIQKGAFGEAFNFPLMSQMMQFNPMENMMPKQNFQFDKIAQDATSFGREGMEAFMKSCAIYTKGCEEMTRKAAEMCQNAAEKQAEYAKQMMGSKTINEFAEAQNKIAQASFDEFMAGATKLSEMGVKVLSESIEPINEQINKGMQKAGKSMAA